MRPEDLDHMADTVEELMAYLQLEGLISSHREFFLVSRYVEYGLRNYSASRVAEIMERPERSLARELRKLGLPCPSALMDLGVALGVARQCMSGQALVSAARRFGIDRNRAGCTLERCFGVKFQGLAQFESWKNLVDAYLDRRWPKGES